MFEEFIITNHIIERYLQRVGGKKSEVIKRIKYDVGYKKVTRIININDSRHVFVRNGKEFIFQKDNRGSNIWILLTINKRTRERQEIAIKERIRQAEYYNV